MREEGRRPKEDVENGGEGERERENECGLFREFVSFRSMLFLLVREESVLWLPW